VLFRSLADPARTDRYDELILKYSEKYRLNPRLLKGIIAAESEFLTRAVSPDGAIGLMLLMPGTAREFGAEEGRFHDPEQNIMAGAAYLSHLFSRAWKIYKLDPKISFARAPLWLLERVIAAYNAGPRFLRKDGIYRETREYVTKVLLFMRSPVSLFRREPIAPGPALPQPSPTAGALQ
jgi:soluble lytic murein transglycosylase-like protein